MADPTSTELAIRNGCVTDTRHKHGGERRHGSLRIVKPGFSIEPNSASVPRSHDRSDSAEITFSGTCADILKNHPAPKADAKPAASNTGSMTIMRTA